MKKIFIKYKMLVNGLSTKETYKIDGFTLKTSKFDKEIFDSVYNENKEGIDFNLNYYLESCITNKNDLTYNYFESDTLEEIEVSNKYKIDKNKVIKLLETKLEIFNRVDDLERKLRLVLNIPLSFQIVCFEFYDENKKFISAIQGNRPLSFWNRLTYPIESEDFANNSRFGMNYEIVKNTNNNYFNRALEFYNESFESDKIAIRFILIFSSLEAIFNLNSEEITSKLSRYSAKLLAEDDESMYETIYEEMKKLYGKRSKYVHGSKNNNINIEDEKKLRKYVRKIILAYWLIIQNSKMSAKDILKYLDSDKKLDIQIRLYISALNSDNFIDQQTKLLNIIENEIGIKIPEDTKNNILRTNKRI